MFVTFITRRPFYQIVDYRDTRANILDPCIQEFLKILLPMFSFYQVKMSEFYFRIPFPKKVIKIEITLKGIDKIGQFHNFVDLLLCLYLFSASKKGWICYVTWCRVRRALIVLFSFHRLRWDFSQHLPIYRCQLVNFTIPVPQLDCLPLDQLCRYDSRFTLRFFSDVPYKRGISIQRVLLIWQMEKVITMN